jgi:hypothetical protein
MSDNTSVPLKLTLSRREFLISATAATATLINESLTYPLVQSHELPRVGILGLDERGQYHVRQFLSRGLAVVAAIYDDESDRLGEAARKVAQKTSRTPKTTTNLGEFMRDRTLNAVVIAGPLNRRFEFVKQLLETGNHGLVEPPIYTDMDQRHLLRQFAKNSRSILQVNLPSRAMGIPPVGRPYDRQMRLPRRVSSLLNTSTQLAHLSLFEMVADIDLLLKRSASPERPSIISAQSLSGGVRKLYRFVITDESGAENTIEIHVQGSRAFRPVASPTQMSDLYENFFRVLRNPSHEQLLAPWHSTDVAHTLAYLGDLSAKLGRGVELNVT